MSLVAIGIGSAVVGIGASAVGAAKAGKQSKQAQKQAAAQQKQLDSQIQDFKDFEFQNAYEGIGDQLSTFDAAQVDAASSTSQGYSAAQAQLGTLGKAQGYSATQAEAAKLGPAGQVQMRNLAAGADFLSNPFANLQVGTAATDRKAAETDAALAASLESGQITGGGGATALARAAAGAKGEIGASLQQQEQQNNQLRAQGEQSLQQGLLAQSNLQNQFGFEQDRFNVGARNEFAQQQASFTQQANLANAAAQNEAAQFTAGAQNQFALSRFDAQNQLSQFNVGAQNEANRFTASAANQAAQSNAQLAQQANLANQEALNQQNRYAADTFNQGTLLEAQGQQAQFDNQANRELTLLNLTAGSAQQAGQNAANAKAGAAQAWGNIGGAALGAAGTAFGNIG